MAAIAGWDVLMSMAHEQSRRRLGRKIRPLYPCLAAGGWTWYTGSAGWMYRLIVESLLGMRLTADRLSFAPLLPADWEGFTLHYRYRETVYHITVLRGQEGDDKTGVTVDGAPQRDTTITLVDDHQEHAVEVNISCANS